MRLSFSILVLLVFSTVAQSTVAQSETLDLTIVKPASDSSARYAINSDRVFDLRLHFGSPTIYWQMHVLNQTDANYVFTLNETTAPLFGADWNAIHTRFQSLGIVDMTLDKQEGENVHTLSHRLNLVPPTDLHSVDLIFTTEPRGTSGDSFYMYPVITYRLTTQVPEPSSLLLALFGFAWLANRRRPSRPQPLVTNHRVRHAI